ncbi:hypothetical protein [Bifidobacterium miconisargentati]|uniref:hypothetical protein n=1 Tax=Bifidobacterium miconisargentati TaxID=2834437 RepID=UPI001F30FCAC|nr:hypothetical protein [Bifidobacterium miconisargentati]
MVQASGPITAEQAIGRSEEDAGKVLRTLYAVQQAAERIRLRYDAARNVVRKWNGTRIGLTAVSIVLGIVTLIGMILVGYAIATQRPWKDLIVTDPTRGIIYGYTGLTAVIAIVLLIGGFLIMRVRCEAHIARNRIVVYKSAFAAITAYDEPLRSQLPAACRSTEFVTRAAKAMRRKPTVGEALLAADVDHDLTVNETAIPARLDIDVDAIARAFDESIRSAESDADNQSSHRFWSVDILPFLAAVLTVMAAAALCVTLNVVIALSQQDGTSGSAQSVTVDDSTTSSDDASSDDVSSDDSAKSADSNDSDDSNESDSTNQEVQSNDGETVTYPPYPGGMTEDDYYAAVNIMLGNDQDVQSFTTSMMQVVDCVPVGQSVSGEYMSDAQERGYGGIRVSGTEGNWNPDPQGAICIYLQWDSSSNSEVPVAWNTFVPLDREQIDMDAQSKNEWITTES